MRPRSLLGPLPCLFGLHDWGEPRAMNRGLVISGERGDSGDWDIDIDDTTEKVVTQHCQQCRKYRDRDDLDWDDVRDW